VNANAKITANAKVANQIRYRCWQLSFFPVLISGCTSLVGTMQGSKYINGGKVLLQTSAILLFCMHMLMITKPSKRSGSLWSHLEGMVFICKNKNNHWSKRHNMTPSSIYFWLPPLTDNVRTLICALDLLLIELWRRHSNPANFF